MMSGLILFHMHQLALGSGMLRSAWLIALFNLVVTSGENPGVEAQYMAQAYNVPVGHYVKFDIPTYFDMTIISVSVSSSTDDDLHGTLEILL